MDRKSPRRIFFLFFALLFVTHLCRAQSSLTLRDFRQRGCDYGFEEWKSLASVQTKTDTGIHLKGAARGGAGVVLGEGVNLADKTELEVKLKRGAENTEKNLVLTLVGSDKSSFAWRIVLADVSDTDFTVMKLELSKAAGKLKFDAVKQMQIQGTFGPGVIVDVEIESVVATAAVVPPKP